MVLVDDERETMLLENMRRWRRVAEIEHAKYCTANHDHSRAIEVVYNDLRTGAVI